MSADFDAPMPGMDDHVRAVLLDTHAFLWFVFGDPRLSIRAASVIEDADIEKNISIAGLWEIVIKHQLGRLRLGMEVGAFLDEHVVRRTIGVYPSRSASSSRTACRCCTGPVRSNLVAQAKGLDLPVVTSDPAFTRYGVKTIW